MKKFELQIENAKKRAIVKSENYMVDLKKMFQTNAIAEAFLNEIELGDTELDLELNIDVKLLALKYQVKLAQDIIDDANRQKRELEKRFPDYKPLGSRN
tara:strand:- start:614 stop:910 length:297 start_codon:yes stop_codon:yes gene_type:complete